MSPLRLAGTVQTAFRVGVSVDVNMREAGAEGTLANRVVKGGEIKLSPMALTDET